jgi:hypothetical protein
MLKVVEDMCAIDALEQGWVYALKGLIADVATRYDMTDPDVRADFSWARCFSYGLSDLDHC